MMVKGESNHPIKQFSSQRCVLCGKPSAGTFEFDAVQERTRYSLLGRVEETRFGINYLVPYCADHLKDAKRMAKRIKGFEIINTIANGLLMLVTIILMVFLVNDPLEENVLGSLALKFFWGVLLSGLLLFPFGPLFRLISGSFFTVGLSKAQSRDLKNHHKAHGPGMPYTGSLNYLPGISVNYLVPHRQTLPVTATVMVTDPSFAQEAKVWWLGEVLLEKEKRAKTLKKGTASSERLILFCSCYKFNVEMKKVSPYQTLICDKSIQGNNNKNPCQQFCLRNQLFIDQLENIFWKQNWSKEAILNFEKTSGYQDYTRF